MGRCAPTTGIAPLGELVEQVMTQEPYASARRVFWVVDNGSSHAGQASIWGVGLSTDSDPTQENILLMRKGHHVEVQEVHG